VLKVDLSGQLHASAAFIAREDLLLSLDRRLIGLQNHSRHIVGEKKHSLLLHGETNAEIPVTLPAELHLFARVC